MVKIQGWAAGDSGNKNLRNNMQKLLVKWMLLSKYSICEDVLAKLRIDSKQNLTIELFGWGDLWEIALKEFAEFSFQFFFSKTTYVFEIIQEISCAVLSFVSDLSTVRCIVVWEAPCCCISKYRCGAKCICGTLWFTKCFPKPCHLWASPELGDISEIIWMRSRIFNDTVDINGDLQHQEPKKAYQSKCIQVANGLHDKRICNQIHESHQTHDIWAIG